MTNIKQRDELQAAIWKIANEVRGAVDGWDFKQFVLGTLFYRFISENFTNFIEAGDESVDYAHLSDDVITPEIKDDATKTKGYFIYPSQLFVNIAEGANSNPNLNTDLATIFNAIESSANGYASEHDIKGLFADFDTTSNRLGNTVEEKNKRLAAVIKGVESLDFGNFEDSEIDLFGDAYEFLISNYAANAGKSGGEFFTPQNVSKLIAQLALFGQSSVNKIYDPACGSGSLLLQAKKQFDEETGLYYYGARYLNPVASIWYGVDPLAEKYVNIGSYIYCHSSPIMLIDPTGEGDYYAKNGSYLGTDKKNDNLTYLATGVKNGEFVNARKIDLAHSDFTRVANIISHEAGTNDEKEALWLAHTVKNRADEKCKTMLGLLLTGYSSVSKADKQKGISTSDGSRKANAARAGVIDALTSKFDPTDGAQFWDGTDFLAWGLSSPDGSPQNKFEEYHTVVISQKIYNDFLKNQQSRYPKGSVNYYGKKYIIPAAVFTNTNNWKNGYFTYSWPKAAGAHSDLKATGTAGHSIFWKIEKR